MNLTIGDTVRYLNAVGGGKVVRIAGDMAYIDEDGFETPVLARECVVVAHAGDEVPTRSFRAPRVVEEAPKAAVQVKEKKFEEPTKLPVVETAGGNVLNIVLGFEASDLRALSQASFDAFIVNDSNYYLSVAIMTRSDNSDGWNLRYSGTIEPNIQEFAFTLENSELAHFDRMTMQYVAYKTDSAFDLKTPGFIEFNVDATKFAKLHCFRPNPYFDTPVIAFDVTVNDKQQRRSAIDAQALAQSMQDMPKSKETPKRQPQRPQKEHTGGDPLVVDLHASELFGSVEGLSASDILNAQVDRFCEVMNANLRHPGIRIVFIHGKGEGVLRQALMKELNYRYKGHDVQDASFREYGFGATQVTIRQTAQQPHHADKKNNKRHGR